MYLHWSEVDERSEPILPGSFAEYCNSMKQVSHESALAWDRKTPEEKAAHIQRTVPAAQRPPLVVVIKQRLGNVPDNRSFASNRVATVSSHSVSS